MKRETGQAALIVLLIMAAALTLGLATSKKVVVDTKINKDEELLKQAFNAAESGIQTYLGSGIQGGDVYHSTDQASTADVIATDIGNSTIVTYTGYVLPNKAAAFWLVGHNKTGNQNINTGQRYNANSVEVCASGNAGALRVSLYNQGGSRYYVNRWIFNLAANYVANGTDVDGASGLCPSGLNHITTLTPLDLGDPAHNLPVLITLTPVGVPMNLALQGSTNFPIQGQLITSTGKAGGVSSKPGATRTVSQEVRWDGGLFDYLQEGIQSETGISP